MPSSINASTSGAGGVITTADNSGVLNIQTAGTTALTISATQAATFANSTSSASFIPTGSTAPTNGIYLPGTNIVGFVTNGTERTRLTATGQLLVGTTASIAGKIQGNGGSSGQGIGAWDGPANGNFISGDSSGTFFIAFGRDNQSTGDWVFYNPGGKIAVINYSTGAYSAVSDGRLKRDIEPLTYGLNEVLQLNPVTYNFKTEDISTKRHIGLIAQEVKAVMDETVDDLKDPEQSYALDKSGLVPILINAIKELNAKVDAQAVEIAALKAGA